MVQLTGIARPTMPIEMIWKLALALVLALSARAFAEPDWNSYLKTKGKRCSLTVEQLNQQVASQTDLFVQQIGDELKSRGSNVTSIEAPRDQVEIGIFPKVQGFDFWVNAKVIVNIQKLNFSLQTTLAGDPTPVVKQGLWFPLAANDTGTDKVCKLERVTADESQRADLPVVDLVIGAPVRVVARGLVQVVNIKSEPPPPVSPPPVSPPPVSSPEAPPEAPPVAEKKSVSEENKSQDEVPARESRRERRAREHRRERERNRERERERERRRSRHHRHRQVREDVPAAGQLPVKADECAGDRSFWKGVACSLKGK